MGTDNNGVYVTKQQGVVFPILPRRKQRSREVKEQAQGHTANGRPSSRPLAGLCSPAQAPAPRLFVTVPIAALSGPTCVVGGVARSCPGEACPWAVGRVVQTSLAGSLPASCRSRPAGREGPSWPAEDTHLGPRTQWTGQQPPTQADRSDAGWSRGPTAEAGLSWDRGPIGRRLFVCFVSIEMSAASESTLGPRSPVPCLCS